MIADDVARHVDLVIGFRIHEVEAVAILIEVADNRGPRREARSTWSVVL